MVKVALVRVLSPPVAARQRVGACRAGDLAAGEGGHPCRGGDRRVGAGRVCHPRSRPTAKVTLAVLVVTVFPPESSTVTAGWVVQAAALAPPPGWVVKASWAAGPTRDGEGALVPLARPDELAVNV